MFRIFWTVGGVALDLVSLAYDGGMAASMMAAGMIVAVLHCALHASPFQFIVNHLTGCDLPESLSQPVTVRTNDDPRFSKLPDSR